jgi:putative ABC transport system substrate-binding protein
MVMIRAALAVALAVGILAVPLASEAQQATKVWRIGYLGFEYPTQARDREALPSPVTLPHQTQIVELAAKNRLPAMYPYGDFTESGGLMAYSTNRTEMYRRSATFVDKILKGAKPADLPIEQPTKFELVINLKTAKALGLTIPPSVLLRADQIIE